MSEEFRLPPKLQAVADLIENQPSEVRDMFRYALVVMLVDDEKARVIGTRTEAGGEYLKVQTIAGDTFEIYKPPVVE